MKRTNRYPRGAPELKPRGRQLGSRQCPLNMHGAITKRWRGSRSQPQVGSRSPRQPVSAGLRISIQGPRLCPAAQLESDLQNPDCLRYRCHEQPLASCGSVSPERSGYCLAVASGKTDPLEELRYFRGKRHHSRILRGRLQPKGHRGDDIWGARPATAMPGARADRHAGPGGAAGRCAITITGS